MVTSRRKPSGQPHPKVGTTSSDASRALKYPGWKSTVIPGNTVESAFARKANFAKFVERGVIDPTVISSLFEAGRAIRDEAVMWDFKQTLPVLPPVKPNDHIKKQHEIKMSEIVKDCVAFYNSYGGYLVIGVDDRTRSVVEFRDEFDAADLNKKIQGSTGVSIETIFRLVDVNIDGSAKKFGLLFIPKRPQEIKPVQFKKDAPDNGRGGRAYRQNDFYLRERDNCRTASTVEDFEFVFSQRYLQQDEVRPSALDHNLPPRDYDFVNLIGREAELSLLYGWLPDAFRPLIILCGVGGVGKTSIAYDFAERIVYQAPKYIDKLIWLGAKQFGFGPLSSQEYKLPRVDFSNIDQLLLQLLLETGCPANQIPEQPSRDQLLNLAQEHLSGHQYLLVIDNVDSLEDDEQQQIFSIFMQLCSMSRAKAVVTARRNLGASRTLYTEIGGLSPEDFQEFVGEKCEFLRIAPPIKPGSKEMNALYAASGGSPLFALSIMRLILLGDSFADAVANWSGSDGELVRRAAFDREIGRLDADARKVLLVLCYVEQATAVEIANLVGLTRHDIHKALEGVQSFSMTTVDHSPPGAATFKVPATLRLVGDLVEKRVPDWERIKKKCAEHIALRNDHRPFVSRVIGEAMRLLREKDAPEALIVTANALINLPENSDLHCMMGRVYLSLDDSRAEDSYQKSFDLGCRKRELLDGWIEYRQKRSDWLGVINIAKVGEREHKMGRYALARYQAEMMIGDQFAKIGEYESADSRYEGALRDLTNLLDNNTYPAEAKSFGNLKNSLIIRWLGAVRMSASRTSGWQFRYFGACCKAITVFKSADSNVLAYSMAALNEVLERVADRDQISDTAYGQVDQASSRLENLASHLKSRSDIPEGKKERFAEDAERGRRRIEAIRTRH